MVNDEKILQQLMSIKDITHSYILAFALLDSSKRKLSWQQLIGAQAARTYKIKQSATAGLTGQALRTGKPQSISMQSDEERFCFGEAIMMTEQLSHIYVWPVAFQHFSYQGVIIIGNKEDVPFQSEKLVKASHLIEEIEKEFNVCSLLI